MIPTVVAAQGSTSTSAAFIDVARPAGAPAKRGDWFVVFVGVGGNTAFSAPDATWEKMAEGSGPSGNVRSFAVFTRRVTGPESGQDVWRFTDSLAARNHVAVAVLVRGGEPRAIAAGSDTGITHGVNDATPAARAITTTQGRVLVLTSLLVSAAAGAANKTGGAPSGDTLAAYASENGVGAQVAQHLAVASQVLMDPATSTTNAWTTTADDATSEWSEVAIGIVATDADRAEIPDGFLPELINEDLAQSAAISPATLTLAPQAVTGSPGSATASVSPTTLTLTPIGLVGAPGAASSTLAPATLTLTPQALTATPGATSGALAPATLTLAAVTLVGAPGAVTASVSPAALTLSAIAIVGAPGTATGALSPALLTLTAVPVTATLLTAASIGTALLTLDAIAITATPGDAIAAISPAALTLAPIALTGVPEAATATITAALLVLAAQALTATPGTAAGTITPVNFDLEARPLLTDGAGTIDALALELTGAGLTATPGATASSITPATLALEAIEVLAAAGPTSTTIEPALLELIAVALEGQAGTSTTAIEPALLTLEAVALITAIDLDATIEPAEFTLIAVALTALSHRPHRRPVTFTPVTAGDPNIWPRDGYSWP